MAEKPAVESVEARRPYDWQCDACKVWLEDPPPIGRTLDPCPNCGARRWLPHPKGTRDAE